MPGQFAPKNRTLRRGGSRVSKFAPGERGRVSGPDQIAVRAKYKIPLRTSSAPSNVRNILPNSPGSRGCQLQRAPHFKGPKPRRGESASGAHAMAVIGPHSGTSRTKPAPAGLGNQPSPGSGRAWLWQDSWLEPGSRRRIVDTCSSSDQLSGRGKIPDLAGGSTFYGPMAKRKWSRALLRKMTRSSGLLSMSTLRRRIKIHP